MDLILLYRTVILDIIIMLFLLAYGLYCKKYDEGIKRFIPFAAISLVYSIFGLITEITVNSTTLPAFVNDFAHVFYFAFGLLFSFNYFMYVLELVVEPKIYKILVSVAAVLSATCIVVMIFSDIIYIEGAGTKYSQGMGPTLCYALGFILLIISDITIIVNNKRVQNSIWYALIPISFVAIILLVIQIIYPLFLFSESAIVLVSIGAFFAIEDPIGKFQKSAKLYHDYAYIDGLTGLYNRRSYSEELAKYSDEVPSDIVCISMDLNGLKNVNDTLGHEAGDEIIVEAGRLITEAFDKYGKIFRTGGDEYVGIIRASRKEYEDARNCLKSACAKWTGKYSDHINVSVGAGFIEDTENNNILEIVNAADKKMYVDKSNYYKTMGIDRRGQESAHKALCDLYTKIIKINLTKDTHSVVDMKIDENHPEPGYSEKISEWLMQFAKSGSVHKDDVDEYLKKTDIDYLKNYFNSGKTSISIEYRRKYGDEFKQAAMEMIPADDYSPDNQTLFLYVKMVEK